jgi:hypothetical protein
MSGCEEKCDVYFSGNKKSKKHVYFVLPTQIIFKNEPDWKNVELWKKSGCDRLENCPKMPLSVFLERVC